MNSSTDNFRTSPPSLPQGSEERFTVRILENGEASLRSEREGETFHPGTGPTTEARQLYVDQFALDTLWPASAPDKPFTIWDVGLGAAANATEIIRSLRRAASGHLRMESFDRTLAPLHAALKAHRETPSHFAYLRDVEVERLMDEGSLRQDKADSSLHWHLHLGDFTQWVRSRLETPAPLAAPDFILYDCYSPARNWEMWTLDHWQRIHRLLHLSTTTTAATGGTRIIFYSRSTALRVTLLLAGFRVSPGVATGEKDQTTTAATSPELLPNELDCEWLLRVYRSTASEPFLGEKWRRLPIAETHWKQLLALPQFSQCPVSIDPSTAPAEAASRI